MMTLLVAATAIAAQDNTYSTLNMLKKADVRIIVTG
jgi:hypothetical protein